MSGLRQSCGAMSTSALTAVGMALGDRAFQRGKPARPILAADDRLGVLEAVLDLAAERRRKWKEGRGTEFEEIFAVGPDHRGVDPIHRRSAHRPSAVMSAISCQCRADKMVQLVIPPGGMLKARVAGCHGRSLPWKTIMPAFKSDFLRILSERGFIHQMSDGKASTRWRPRARRSAMSATTARRRRCISAIS